MKKTVSVITLVSMLVCFVFFSGFSSLWKQQVELQGTGTAEDPYLLSGKDELVYAAELMNSETTKNEYAHASYVLTADIDLGNRKWTPITLFYGVLDGDGHTISGLSVSAAKGVRNYGLIGELCGTVRDLTISDSEITVKGSKSERAGAITGVSHGVLDNCTVTDTVTVKCSYMAGGLVGQASAFQNAPCIIRNCTNAATVIGTSTVSEVGGVGGSLSCDVICCTNSGSIQSEADAGGIAGSISGTVTDCTNYGEVSSSCKHGGVGGICAKWSDGALNSTMNDPDIRMENCSNFGAITGGFLYAGGICGRADTGSMVNCTNSGAVSGQGEAGGILGLFQTSPFGTPCKLFVISHCTNSGEIRSAESSSGGIAGGMLPAGSEIRISDCANSGKVHAVDYGGGIVGSLNCYGREEGVAYAMQITRCTSDADICVSLEKTGIIPCAGGILGSLSASVSKETVSLEITECSSAGSVHTGLRECKLGGIVGRVQCMGEVVVEECESTASLIADLPKYTACDAMIGELSREF